MTFEGWLEKEVVQSGNHNTEFIPTLVWSRMAWEYQQAIIDDLKKYNASMVIAYNRITADINGGETVDMEWIEGVLSDAKHECIVRAFEAKIRDLKDQLESERRRADEYYDKWDNLMKGSEG